MEIPPFPAPSVLPKAEKRLSSNILERRRTTKPVPFPRRRVNSVLPFGPSGRRVLSHPETALIPRAGLPAWVPRPTSAFPRVPAVACWTRNSPLRRRSRAGFSPASLFSRPAPPQGEAPGTLGRFVLPIVTDWRGLVNQFGGGTLERAANPRFGTFLREEGRGRLQFSALPGLLR